MRRFIYKILVLANLLMVLGLLLSYLSNYINPAKVWYFAFFGLAYPFLMIINLSFLIFWTLFRKKVALLSLVVIIIGFGYIGRYVQISHRKMPISCDSSIRVLSYNVRVFNHFEWEKNTSMRDSIINYVNINKATLVCFQDFLTRPNHKEQSERYILQKLLLLPYHHIEYTYNFNSRSSKYGIATYSHYPIVNRGSIRFNHSLNACIYTDILINNDTVRVYNVHLQSTRLKKNSIFQSDSILPLNNKKINEMKDITGRLKTAYIYRGEQVNLVAEHIKNSPYPVIICGDFNDTPISYTYHKLLGDRKDSFREAGKGFGKTYRGELPSYRIDYIFHSDLFKTLTFETGNVTFSDHFPIICNLKYNPEK